MYVIGEPSRIKYYGKMLKYHGKYRGPNSGEANQRAKELINTGKYVAVVAGSLKDKQSDRPQFFIVYIRKKLEHEIGRK